MSPISGSRTPHVAASDQLPERTLRSDQCSLCHQPSECTDCHSVELPESHDNFFRRRGHGLIASMDRQSCATCHDSDSCDRCHQEFSCFTARHDNKCPAAKM